MLQHYMRLCTLSDAAIADAFLMVPSGESERGGSIANWPDNRSWEDAATFRACADGEGPKGHGPTLRKQNLPSVREHEGAIVRHHAGSDEGHLGILILRQLQLRSGGEHVKRAPNSPGSIFWLPAFQLTK